MRRLTLAAIALLGVALSSCSTVSSYDAARDVHRFLVAVRDNDRYAFDRYVDRRALTYSLESQLIDQAQDSGLPRELRILGSLLAGPTSNALGDLVIRPSVFRAIAVSLGYSPSDVLPSRLSIATSLRRVGRDDYGRYDRDRRDRVCAARSERDPCLLTFERQGDTWRLVSVDAPLRELKF